MLANNAFLGKLTELVDKAALKTPKTGIALR